MTDDFKKLLKELGMDVVSLDEKVKVNYTITFTVDVDILTHGKMMMSMVQLGDVLGGVISENGLEANMQIKSEPVAGDSIQADMTVRN